MIVKDEFKELLAGDSVLNTRLKTDTDVTTITHRTG